MICSILKSYKIIGIYNIRYIAIKKIDHYENINSVNPLYLMISEVEGFIEEKKNRSKYLISDSTDENKEVSKKYKELWDGIKNKIKTINDGKESEYNKDFMKIKFDTDDDLRLNKPLNLHMLRIIVRSVFQEDGKLYPQVFFT